MVYLLINFQYAIGMFNAIRSNLRCRRYALSHHVTIQEYIETCQVSDERFLLSAYFVPTSSVLMVALNSMLNPIIYFWRIRLFRKWVVECFRGKCPFSYGKYVTPFPAVVISKKQETETTKNYVAPHAVIVPAKKGEAEA